MRRSLALSLLILAGCGGSGDDMSDWTKTESGLKYKDLKEGDGPPAKAGQSASMRYTGWLAKGGKKFDSNTGRLEPFVFTLGRGEVIEGWDEGVVGMKAGGKRKLFIPSKLGYAERGSGDRIPANADLMFEVELLELADPPKVSIEELKVGSGATAKAGQTVVVHYTGWLAKDGKKFDSSHDRKEPIVFTLGAREVIRGWDEGVEGMKAGGKRKLRIPAALGYGTRGKGKIPPGADLVFDVELLEIKK